MSVPPAGWPPRRAAGAAAGRRELMLGLAAAALGAAFWLAYVAWQGFHLSPDSMSYAALARGFATGRPFTSSIYWRGSAPGRLQGNWPPLYPLTIAAAHAFGLSYPWSEFALSGASVALACGFAAAAVHRAAGALPLAALALLASFYDLLYVAAWGWSEPGFDALLSVLFWLCARAARAAAEGPAPPAPVARQLVWCGLVAGVAYLQRYAAVPFVVGVGGFAVAIGLLAGPADAPARARLARAARSLGAAALGAALPALPWTLADLVATGHVGTAYLPVGAGWAGAWGMTRRALRQAFRLWLHPGVPGGALSAGLEHHLALGTAACAAAGLALAALRRARAARGPEGMRPAEEGFAPDRPPARAGRGTVLPGVALAGLLVFCALGYGVFLIAVRARFYFDPIDLRLIAPGAWTAVLALLLLLALLPAPPRELLAAPLAAVLVLHGVQMARFARRNPEIAASLNAPLCVAGPGGDCSLFAWLRGSAGAGDLLVTNAPFTINLALGLPVQQVSAYPYDPYATPSALRRWASRWWALHPAGSVYVVVDSAVGAVDAGGYGAFFASFATAPAVGLGGGWNAKPVAAGRAWRVLRVSRP